MNKVKGFLAMGMLLVWQALGAAAPLPQTLRVATFNVHDYFCKERVVNGIFFKNYAKPQEECQALRATLCEVRPDVLVIQEIQKTFLFELQRDLSKEGLTYPYAYALEGPDPQRCLAALTCLEPKAVIKHGVIPFTYKGKACTVKRGLLELHFETPEGFAWTLYTVHLKSKIQKSQQERKEDPDCEGFRSAEAQALRRTLLGHEDPDTAPLGAPACFLIAGDFNDHPRSKCVCHLETYTQKQQKHTLSERLELKELNHPKLPTWTLHSAYSASWHTVDHILVSPQLKPHLAAPYAQLSEPSGGSDHRLVYVDLVLQEALEYLSETQDL